MPSLSVSRLLSADEALRRLATVRFGRLVYSRHALFAVRPADHIIEDGTIVLHVDPAVLTITGDRQVVAFEADAIDHDTHAGWFATAAGVAEEITDPDRRTRYRHLWDQPRDGRLFRIRPERVTGAEYSWPAVESRERSESVRPADIASEWNLQPGNRIRPVPGPSPAAKSLSARISGLRGASR
ncbi:pyridoxamine 5'-phosphate oxidase family protein [Nocardia sp. BMG51109]|uniref:pyridoxamine 5'-phosphate oxidase family protein n=1 Tax=Nocardia sp. BMG51109 TaxID=1056816 RepID=UPI0004632AB5|nr:pyridoxamine 5'-phosphate oxidase family protein [Nocardia sp. BMG51109]